MTAFSAWAAVRLLVENPTVVVARVALGGDGGVAAELHHLEPAMAIAAVKRATSLRAGRGY